MAEPPDDLSRPIALLGLVMILGSFAALGLGAAGAFAITALVWGAIIVSLSLWARARNNAEHRRHLEEMERQTAERQRLELSRELLRKVLDRPGEFSLSELRELLRTDLGAKPGASKRASSDQA